MDINCDIEFEEILDKFAFLFDSSNDIRKDVELSKKNAYLLDEKEKYSQIALAYLEKNISKMAPLTLLSNLGLLSLGESHKLIPYSRRINQYELDFMMALVLKYGVMKLKYEMSSGEIEINRLLDAIDIYIFCMDHELLKGNMEAQKINNFYRMNRIVGLNDKFDTIKKFCSEYDKSTSKERIKLTNVICFIFAIEQILQERLNIILGHTIYLEEQKDFFIFTPGEIRDICKKNQFDFNKVVYMISKFCCMIGSLKETEVKEIYLDNPVNDKFVILSEKWRFFVPNFNLIFMNFFEIIEKIIEYDKHDNQIYFVKRTEFLERETVKIIEKKFKGHGKIYANSQWNAVRHGENDCILLYENYAIIFEDKSGRVNRKTYKGILRSAYTDYKKLIEEASEQATFFENYIEDNLGKQLHLKVKGGGENIIDLERIRHILKVGIVFEETVLQNIVLGEKKHSPIISIFQLNKIFECLEKEEIIDYFIKRNNIERNIAYIADEYDFLYVYLKNGFNTSDKIYEKNEKVQLAIPYTEEVLSRKYLEREKWFQIVLDSVIQQKKENWFEKVISLLEIPPVVQKQIIREVIIRQEIYLQDNIKIRNKVIVVKLIEYYDSDIEKEINQELMDLSRHLNVLYIVFTEKFEHIIVKLKHQ